MTREVLRVCPGRSFSTADQAIHPPRINKLISATDGLTSSVRAVHGQWIIRRAVEWVMELVV
jgi:hypothetical protein